MREKTFHLRSAAELVGVTRETLFGLVGAGKVAGAYRDDDGRWAISETDLQRFIKSRGGRGHLKTGPKKAQAAREGV